MKHFGHPLMRTIACVGTLVGAAAVPATAQEFPNRTIEVVTHAGNGGGTDVTARMMMIRGRRALDTDMVVVNLAEASSQIDAGDVCPIVVLAPERMSALPDTSTAQELGINANFSTVRGFVVHADTPDEVAAQIEEALLDAMNHSVFQSFLVSAGLDATSVAGSEVWGNQITSMLGDMDAALRDLGFIE